MKLLIEESVPRRLISSFPESFHTKTVQDVGWAGTENGALLSLAADSGFDALLTVDRGIEFQQNVSRLPIAVLLMLAPRNRLAELKPLVPKVLDVLAAPLHRCVYRISE